MGLIRMVANRLLSPSRVKAALDALPAPPHTAPVQGFRVAAVQRRIASVREMADYVLNMDAFVSSAREAGCRLIAFPEHNGLDLTGLIPGQGAQVKKGMPYFAPPGEIAEPLARAMREIFSRLALRHGMYVYSGTFPQETEGGYFLTGALFSPGGAQLLAQKKLHPDAWEREMGFMPGDRLERASIRGAGVCCPAGGDGNFFEVFRLAYDQGCDLVLLPYAGREALADEQELCGAWMRAQESYLYCARPALIGEGFSGRAAVFAPMDATDRNDGVLKMSRGQDEDELVVAELDFERLYAAREEAETFGDRNAEFEKKYFRSVRPERN